MSLKRAEQQFSVEEAAKYFMIHPKAISRLLDAGELGYYKKPDRRMIGMYHLRRFEKREQRKAQYERQKAKD